MAVGTKRRHRVREIPDLAILGVEDVRAVRLVEHATHVLGADQPAGHFGPLEDHALNARLRQLVAERRSGQSSADYEDTRCAHGVPARRSIDLQVCAAYNETSEVAVRAGPSLSREIAARSATCERATAVGAVPSPDDTPTPYSSPQTFGGARAAPGCHPFTTRNCASDSSTAPSTMTPAAASCCR